ncbi:MAG: FAD-dependent oxidoreductase [Nitrospirae bacterium]|nr:FAD-dependent oxidoreductase [Nitrospirota bacterium]
MDNRSPELLPDETKKVLSDTFKQLKNSVEVEVYLNNEANQYNEATSMLLDAIAGLSDKIKLSSYNLDSEQAAQRGITRSPTILINPGSVKVSYVGAPVGEEGRTLIMALILVSNNGTILSEQSLKRLLELKEPRHIQVFVSPTCPYCPQHALVAISAAIALPELISVEIIEMYENRDYTDKYHIISVPFTVINEVPIGGGVRPPEMFVEEILSLSSSEVMSASFSGDVVELDMAIIGGGPAGLAAGIYAGRSGLKTGIIEKATVGGQILITPVVENYPGYSQIAGKNLVDIMYQQSLQYSYIFENESVLEVAKSDNIFELKTTRRLFRAKGIIIVTGAEHRKLDAPGEKALYGRGVSYCATCDGYFFKDGGKVIVVGGGNSAVTDALYLNSLGAKVSLVHRGPTLRAEAFLQKSLSERDITVYREMVVDGIYGKDRVDAVKLKNLKDGSVKEHRVDGVFISIGYTPNNQIAKMLNIPTDKDGYVKTDSTQRTSMRMVYAAGDVTGGVKQIATAVGQGSVAAISAFEDLSSPYWKKKTG